MKFLFSFLFVLSTLFCHAYSITEAEYFIDTDPGIGNGTPISFTPDSLITIDLNIDLTGLSEGHHTLYIRTKSDSGLWSHTLSYMFLKDSPDTMISELEYFIDSDPGNGNATEITISPSSDMAVDFTAALDSLSPGLHALFVRGRSGNRWSESSVHLFQKNPEIATDNVVAAELFIDNDPGFGNGTAISMTPDSMIDLDHIADLSSISAGLHTIFVRCKDDKGHWSITNNKSFINLPPDITPQIIKGEFYIDADPGTGSASELSFTSDSSVDIQQVIPLSGLSDGLHNLGLRFMDNNNSWSHVQVHTFIHKSIEASPTVTRVEYFIDSDPGTGNATQVTISNDSLVEVNEVLSLQGFNPGIHTLTIRTMDSLGSWSIAFSKAFLISEPDSSLITYLEYSVDSFIGHGAGTSLPISASMDVDSNLNASLLSQPLGNHMMMLRARDDNNNWSQVFYHSFCVSPGADFQVGKICTDVPELFTDLSTGTDSNSVYIWDMNGDGINDVTSAGSHTFTYSSAGTYNVRLIVYSDSTCQDTLIKPVTVFDPMIPVITGPSAFCDGDTISLKVNPGYISYQWSNGIQADSIIISQGGAYSITVVDTNTCASSDTLNVIKNALPVISAGNDTTGCDGTPLILVATGGVSYNWFNAGIVNDTLGITIATGSSTYVVEGTDLNGCSSRDTLMVTGNPNPVSNFTAGVTSGCSPLSVQFASSSNIGVAYNWNFGDGSTSALNNPSHVYLTGTFDVQLVVVSAMGCADTVFKPGYINSLPFPSLTGTVGSLSGAVTKGEALLYNADNIGMLSPALVDNFNSTQYSLTNIPPGNYKLLLIPDYNTYPNHIREYYNDGAIWDSATVLNLGCSAPTTINFFLDTITPLSGDGFISGYVIDGPNKTAGDPIPGVDVTLEQNPGGNIIMVSRTDSLGYYSFNNIPDGDYRLLVNIPGLGMDSSYTININGVDTVFNELNYFVGDSVIYISEITGLAKSQAYSEDITVFPNPTSGKIYINSDKVYVYDLSARPVMDKINMIVHDGRTTLDLSALSQGVYLVTVYRNSIPYSTRVVKR